MGIPRTVILGAGNVATHLATALNDHVDLRGVWSRSDDNAKTLAGKLGCPVLSSPAEVPADTDLVIISVVDDAVARLAAQLKPVRGIVCHTSGSVPMSVLTDAGHRLAGVFYPMQTFSKHREVDMLQVPFFIEGSDKDTARILHSIAGSISASVHYADSDVRARLHLGAVFACNFANELWRIAADTVRPVGCGLDIYRSLIRETLDKAIEMGPENARTGPAKRHDLDVMRYQAASLDGAEKNIYGIISELISGIPAEKITTHESAEQ